MRSEAKTSEERGGAKRDGARSRYHGVLRSIREVVKAVDRREAGRANISAHLPLLIKEGRKVKAVSSLADLSQAGL